MKRGELELSFSSELSYLDLVQGVADCVTENLGFDEDSRHWIGMSLRESVVNAIQHGNKEDVGKQVGVHFEFRQDRLVIMVRDEGKGFDVESLPDPTDPNNLLKPSGRGVFYVRSFMDHVQFQTLPGGGMEVRMEKKLNRFTDEGDSDEN